MKCGEIFLNVITKLEPIDKKVKFEDEICGPYHVDHTFYIYR